MAQHLSQEEAQRQLLGLVTDEVNRYDKAQYWITDKIALNMREMIKENRKNYWGIYDDPVDGTTGKEKLWVPLTRLLVDAVRKNVNLDPKDVRFRSTDPDSSHFTHLVRGYIKKWLSKTYFNHTLNQAGFTTSVDGTVVWKTYLLDKKIVRKDVDLLNVYIDPSADSIQDTYRFTERVLMTKTEVEKMDWLNKDRFVAEEDVEKVDGEGATKSGEFGDVYESWGYFPKHLVLAAMGENYQEEDVDKEMESQVVISGLNTGAITFHFAEENKEKDNQGNIIKPYEEGWYLKVPNRWYGVGIAETVMPLQYWINTVVNLRIKKNTMAQLGLLKIRRGSKVTQQMLQNLVGKGVIELADPENDLQQLRIDESGQSSYEDEKVARGWAQDITSVFDASLGDLPASTSATGAVIQDRQQRSAFQLVTESMEHLVQRWMDRHVLPNTPVMIKDEKYITFFKDFDDIKKIREAIVANLAMESLANLSGGVPTELEVEEAMRKAERKLESKGDFFIEQVDKLLVDMMETEVFMTNTEVDVAVTVRNLLELRNGLSPEAANEMTAEALDLLGLQVPNSLKEPVQEEQLEAGAAPSLPAFNEQAISTEALALGSEQR